MSANPVLVQLQLLLTSLGFPTNGTTNVPQIEFLSTGLVIPPPAAVLAGVLSDFNAAFGGNMNPAFQTPQGRWCVGIAAAISNCYSLIGMMVNGMDPDLNAGFMQDCIARLYFLDRQGATPTLISCVCLGTAGLPIPIGALVEDTNGALYACQSGGTIPVGGSITLTFAAVVTGPVAYPGGAIEIFESIPGWDAVTSATQVALGLSEESREAFEFQREQSVAANAQGSAVSMFGAVATLPGVADVYVFENTTSAPLTVGSTAFTLVPHSVYLGVVGGNLQDVAQTAWTKKAPGADWNGNSSFTVTDPDYSFPQPSYTVKINDCTQNIATFNLAVNIANSAALPSTIVADVQAAVAAWFNGTAPGSVRVRIGSLLLASSFVGPVATCEGPGVPVSVLSIGIGLAFSATATFVSSSRTLNVTAVGSGSVTCGTPLTSTHVPAGTYIVEQLTGAAGGMGTYLMSVAATSSATGAAVTGTATGTSAQVGVDQSPVLGQTVVTLV